jgi:NADPH:quinone reductase-like Zn-dependent oxidoreductase
VQLAAQAGASVIAVQGGAAPSDLRVKGVHYVDASSGKVAETIRELSGGKGANIVFNTVAQSLL